MGLQKLDDANSLQSFIMKTCVYLAKISNFEYNARSVPVILEHSNFFPSVFIYTNSHTFQGAAKIFEKKTSFRYTLLNNASYVCTQERHFTPIIPQLM